MIKERQNRHRLHSHNGHGEPSATRLMCDSERQEDCLLIEPYGLKKHSGLAHMQRYSNYTVFYVE